MSGRDFEGPGEGTGRATGDEGREGAGGPGRPSTGPTAGSPERHQEVRIPVGRAILMGDLAIPAGASGLVLFAHGSGSSRFSGRNRAVASDLQRAGFATLLFDLLSADEEEVDNRTGELRFDIGLLGDRLAAVTEWVYAGGRLGLSIGYFGASTGAAAALVAAARLPDRIACVVSRGGRPDLAGAALAKVKAPTLLIVGGLDTAVIELNRRALGILRVEKRLEIVPGASHLFEEPGKLVEVSRLAEGWFSRFLRTGS